MSGPVRVIGQSGSVRQPRSFRDRRDAGQALAARLADLAGNRSLIVLGLPRGGVPVAAEVASALDAPLDAFFVRKLGVPGHRELAMGAIATGNVRVVNDEVVSAMHITPQTIEAVAAEERAELGRRERVYRGDRPAPELTDRTVVLVDDGLATGSTMRAAVAAVRAQRPAAVIVGVPTGARQTRAALATEVDRMECVITPDPFLAVGLSYEDFSETTDDEIRRLLS